MLQSDPKIETSSLIVRTPVAVSKKPLVIVAERAFLILAGLVAAAYMWAAINGLE